MVEFLVDGQQRITTLAQQQWLADKWHEGADPSSWRSLNLDGRRIRALQIEFSSWPNLQFKWVPPTNVTTLKPSASHVMVPALLHRNFSDLLDSASKRTRIRVKELRQRLQDRKIVFEPLVESTSPAHALRAFKSINSAGTRLRQSDLAAADLFDAYPPLFGEMESLASKLAAGDGRDDRFDVFHQQLLLYALLFRLTGSANPAILRSKKVRKHALQSGRIRVEWSLVKRGFTATKSFLRNELHMGNGAGIQGYYLITASQILSRKTVSAADRAKLAFWLSMAFLRRPYSGKSTFRKLDRDLAAVHDTGRIKWFKLFQLLQEESGSRSSNSVERRDISPRESGPPKSSFVHQLIWVLAKGKRASDWESGAELPAHFATTDPLCKWERHHIFPKKWVKKNATKKQREMLNRIGNLAFLTKTTNGSLPDEAPSEYLKTLKTRVRPAVLRARLARQHIFIDTNRIHQMDAFILNREDRMISDINALLRKWKQGRL